MNNTDVIYWILPWIWDGVKYKLPLLILGVAIVVMAARWMLRKDESN